MCSNELTRGIPEQKPELSNVRPEKEKLVDAKTLIKLVWDDNSRPSLRWLREQQARRAIPFVKVGARVWFDPEEVRRCLAERWTVGKRPLPGRFPGR